MIKNNFIFYLFISFILQSCQSVEKKEPVVFDYSQFEKLTFLSSKIEIVDDYKQTFQDPYVEHVVEFSPSDRLIDWANNNIRGFGNENSLVILIKNASIVSSTIKEDEKVLGIIKKPEEIKYELNFEILFLVYDDLNNVNGKTNVKISRYVTSLSSLSLDNRDQVLNDLIYSGLKDLSIKSKELTNKYISRYIL